MADIKEFNALRYNKNMLNKLDKLICPPYDIISDDDLNKYLNKHKYNIVNLELPKGINKYKNAQKLLNEWIDTKVLVVDHNPGIYIYEEEFKINNITKNLKGIICLVKLEDFNSGIIIPNENTLLEAKKDRLKLMQATKCNFSLVYSLYNDTNNIKKLIDKFSDKRPEIEVMFEDKVIHRVWKVCEKNKIDSIKYLFKNKKLYIADGHHRYETSLNYKNIYGTKNSDYIMMFLVDMENDGLEVLPTHRLIKGIENYNKNILLDELKKYFDLIKFDNIINAYSELCNNKKYSNIPGFIIYTEKKECFMSVLKTNMISILKNIYNDKILIGTDTYILQEFVFKKYLKMSEYMIQDGKNILYTKDVDTLTYMIDNNKYQLGFLVRAISPQKICRISQEKDKLPQKSTYFYPKPITGLIMNKF